MSLTINNLVGGATAPTTRSSLLRSRSPPSILSLSSRSATHIVAATGKFTSRTGKFDSKNRRSGTTTTKEERERRDFTSFESDEIGNEGFVDDGFVMPKLPGEEPNFWEGPQWDGLGFFVQYMWAFGVAFALVACGVAVATYNDGATDFRETPAYKESVQSKDLSEGLEGSDTDVFESNPTEEAPALE